MAGMRRGVNGLRLARMPEPERDGCAAEILAAYDASLNLLARNGAEIVEVPLPCRFADATTATGRIIGSEAYTLIGDLVDNPALPIDEAVRPRIQLGRNISARDYLGALAERDRMKRDFLAALDGVDALLTPTTQSAAVRVESVDQSTTPAHFTRFVNLLELCALSIPNGFSSTGLPLSLQIVCRPYDEATALRIGWAYQQMTDWHERHPPGLG
jgi:aspartyl-tRNA(Asn)/glutamyl-tRNA(Gln) amidotransferase subunit A